MSIDLGCPPIPPLNTLVECRTATPLRAASRSEQIPPEPPTPPRCARHSGTKRKTAPRAGKKRECKRRRGRNCAPSCRFTPNTGGVSARSMPFPLRLLTAKTAAGRPTLRSAVPGAIWGGWARAQAGDYNMSPPAPPRTPRFSKPRPPARPPRPPVPRAVPPRNIYTCASASALHLAPWCEAMQFSAEPVHHRPNCGLRCVALQVVSRVAAPRQQDRPGARGPPAIMRNEPPSSAPRRVATQWRGSGARAAGRTNNSKHVKKTFFLRF